MEILLPVLGVLVGAISALYAATRRARLAMESAQEHARETLRQAELQRTARIEDARTEAQELVKNVQTELEERRAGVKEAEERIAEKAEGFDRKSQSASDRERNVVAGEREAQATRERLAEIDGRKTQRLSEIAGVSVAQASEELLAQVDANLRHDAQTRLREEEASAREMADENARRLMADTMQRISSPVVPPSAGSSIALTERDQQRISSRPELLDQLAELTDVSLTINEDGSAVTISAQDAVKRELARASLTEVLKNGRRAGNDLERLVKKQEQRLDRQIWDAGVAAARRAGVGRLPDNVISTFGRLQYRYSYGQNQLLHAVETAHLAAMLAGEIGANVEIARAGGLLHDLGKAAGREVEGTHAAIGAQIAHDAGMDERVIHCIAAHHEEIEPATTEAHITIVADALSGARPGARRESLENYLARLKALEAVANGFPGVEKCYAIQAGRELRVIVNPETVDDLGTARMAQVISARIEELLEYPGQVKVIVIREVTTVEHARQR